MRWLVTGAGGQVGSRLVDCLAGADVLALSRADLDVRDADAIGTAIATHRPDVVVNTAAYTAVDRAEDEPDVARAVNVDGPRHLAAALARHGGRLIHLSTDYVFDGTATQPYEPDDPKGPLGVYGQTKLDGESSALAALPERTHVVRTSWVYGGPGANFVDTMLDRAAGDGVVEVVVDQVGSPTSALELAEALVALGAATVPAAVLHFAGAGGVSRYEQAQAAFAEAGADVTRVRAVRTASRPTAARRPAYSVLSTASWTRLGLPAPSPWRDALRRHVAERTGGPRCPAP